MIILDLTESIHIVITDSSNTRLSVVVTKLGRLSDKELFLRQLLPDRAFFSSWLHRHGIPCYSRFQGLEYRP